MYVLCKPNLCYVVLEVRSQLSTPVVGLKFLISKS